MAFDSMPSDNLYMKGLPAGTTEETLRAIFGVYGTVVSCRVLATPAGVSDAAALVRMSSVPEAQYLVENAVNIASGLGSPVQIRFANNTKGAGKGAAAAAQQAVQGMPCAVPGQLSTRLYMKGLPLGMTEDHLKAVIAAYGTVVSLKVLPAPPAGAPDTAAIVQMATEQEAQWLVENLDGNIPQGLATPVQIKYKSDGHGGPAAVPPQLSQQQLMGAAAAQWGASTWRSGESAGPGGDSFYEGQGGEEGGSRGCTPSDNLYMRGLPPGANEDTIVAIFGVYGSVNSVKVLPAPPGKTDVACLVRMGSIEEASWLVDNLNGNIPQGLSEPISIRFADNAKGSGKGKMGMDGQGSYGGPAAAGALSIASYNSGMPPQGGGQGARRPYANHEGGGDGGPSTNLYMKGLPNETTEMSLRTIFGAYGNVGSVKVLACPPGLNSGAALVQMGSPQEAEWLVTHVNNNIPEGLSSPIQIKFANNTKGAGKGGGGGGGGGAWGGGAWAGGGGGGGGGGGAWTAAAPGPAVPVAVMPPPGSPGALLASGGGGGGGGTVPSDNLYMKGFASETDEQTLRAILGPYGNIVSCKVLPPPPGKSCAAALVRMATVDEAKWLVENMNGNIPEGQSQPVEVKYAANQSGTAGKGAAAQHRWSPY